MKVLLIDDDPDVATLVRLALEGIAGWQVDVCAASCDGVERALSVRPDVILLDVMMPGMDGPQTLARLRAREATADIPVVFISAGVDHHDVAAFRDLGAVGIIPKPFDPVRLPQTLAEICRGGCAAPAFPKAPVGLRTEDFLLELRERLDAMGALAASLAAGGWQRPGAQALLETTHRVAGSSGLYGMAALSQAAGVLEGHLRRALEAPWPPSRPPADVVTLVKAVTRHAPRRTRTRSAPTPTGGPGRSSTRSSTRPGTGRATGNR